MKIGVIGSGDVGQTLAAGFVAHGHEVMLGTRDAAKMAGWGQQNHQVKIGGFADVAKFGEVVVLAVKGSVAVQALEQAGGSHLAGKVILDATNPIMDSPPQNGVLGFFTDFKTSLMERLQRQVPAARFVKAFNSVGASCMVNPSFAGGKPTMFIAGNDGAAKATATELLTQLGWETEDCGEATAARAIEPLCILWCIPGFQKNDWRHVFKVLR